MTKNPAANRHEANESSQRRSARVAVRNSYKTASRFLPHMHQMPAAWKSYHVDKSGKEEKLGRRGGECPKSKSKLS